MLLVKKWWRLGMLRRSCAGIGSGHGGDDPPHVRSTLGRRADSTSLSGVASGRRTRPRGYPRCRFSTLGWARPHRCRCSSGLRSAPCSPSPLDAPVPSRSAAWAAPDRQAQQLPTRRAHVRRSPARRSRVRSIQTPPRRRASRRASQTLPCAHAGLRAAALATRRTAHWISRGRRGSLQPLACSSTGLRARARPSGRARRCSGRRSGASRAPASRRSFRCISRCTTRRAASRSMRRARSAKGPAASRRRTTRTSIFSSRSRSSSSTT